MEKGVWPYEGVCLKRQKTPLLNSLQRRDENLNHFTKAIFEILTPSLREWLRMTIEKKGGVKVNKKEAGC
jgi:hypothetical protein